MIKIILILNPNYSIVPATGKKMNSIAAETRTVGWDSSGRRWSEETAVPRENVPHGREMGWKPELSNAVGSGQCWGGAEGRCQCGYWGVGDSTGVLLGQESPHSCWHSPLVPCSPALTGSVAVPARALSPSKSLSKFPTPAVLPQCQADIRSPLAPLHLQVQLTSE